MGPSVPPYFLLVGVLETMHTCGVCAGYPTYIQGSVAERASAVGEVSLDRWYFSLVQRVPISRASTKVEN